MEQDTIDLLKELVAIDSQNPSLVPGAAGESQVAAYVADWAKGAGLTAEIMAETPAGPAAGAGPAAVPVPHGRCCCAGTWTPWGSAR
jgi:acetylornithine deacetylase/succinyl-diaminopimelate desuccinylase-like protein